MTVPVVVGEILVGIVIGQSGLQLVQPDFRLEFLATLGFTFLMFISGLEIDFGLLRNGAATSARESQTDSAAGLLDANAAQADAGAPLWVAAAIFAGTLAGAIGVSFGLSAAGLVTSPWLMSLVLSTTSVGIVVPTLKERGLTPTPFGQAILVTSLVADFGTMALITAVAAILAGRSPAEVGLIGVLFVAFFVLHRLGATFARLGRGLSDGTAQIGVRASFMLMFVFVALANGLGIEVILGAFLAGAVVSLLSDTAGSRLRDKLDAIGFGFFIPIFFIMVGVRFDLAALSGSTQALILIPILLVALYALKVVPSLLWVRFFGWKRAVAGGVLMSARISLMIAAAEIGLRLGVISESINSSIILLAIVTSSLSPVLFAKLVPTPEREKDKCLIVGANRTGIILAGRLAQRGWDVVLLDRDAARLKQAVNGGDEGTAARTDVGMAGVADSVQRRHGDASEPDVLAAAGEGCQTIVILTGDDERNVLIAGHARELFTSATIVATAPDPAAAQQLTDMGVRAVTPALSTLIVLENIVRHPDLLGLLSEDSSEVSVEDVMLRNARYAGRLVRDLPLPDGVLAINLSRGAERIVPRGRTRLALGDRITLVGPPDAVKRALGRLG